VSSKAGEVQSAFYTLKHLYDKGVGGFVDTFYWSSSENNAKNAWNQNFNNGNQNNNKNNTSRVRAVRGFEPSAGAGSASSLPENCLCLFAFSASLQSR